MLTLLMLLQFGAPTALPVLGQTPPHCDTRPTTTVEYPKNGLLDRSREPQEVRRYLLLDRRDRNDCPLPISFPVSGASRGLPLESDTAISLPLDERTPRRPRDTEPRGPRIEPR